MTEPSPTPDPQNPTDASPTDLETQLADQGHDGRFTVQPGARLRCETCGHTSAASEQNADDLHRLEGASDPSDMSMVILVVCPNCAAHGSLTLAYGPDADADTTELVLAIPRDPRGGS